YPTIYSKILHLSLLWLGVFTLTSCQGEAEQCEMIPGSMSLPVLEKKGDITLGGLFSLHDMVIEPSLSFTLTPPPTQCTRFNFRTFRWMQTMIFAIEEINREGKLLPNITLGYKIYDSCSTPHQALKAAMELMGSKGDPGTGGDVQDEEKWHCILTFSSVQVSYFSSCACLSDKKEFPGFLRTMPSDFFQVDALVQLVKHFGWTWVGVIAGDDAYGRGGANIFVRTLGACVALHEIIPKNGAQTAIKTIISKIRSSKARVILVFAVEQDAETLFDGVLREGLMGIQWLASEAWSTAAVLSTPKKYHRILQGSMGFAIRRAHIPGLQNFLLRLHPSYPDAHKDPFLTPFWEEVFQCSLGVQVEGQEQRKAPCSGEEELGSVKNIYSDVSQLRISYNVYKAVYAIAHALKFCADSRCPVSVHCISISLYLLSLDAIECVRCLPEFWSSADRTVCIPKKVEFLSFSDTMGITLMAISLFGSFCTCVVVFIFTWHRNTPVVRANNSDLSFLLLFSLTLCFLCSLTFIGRPSEWSCMLRHTAFGITFVLCISCILGKTIVVLMAFRATLPGSTVMKWFGPAQQKAIIASCTLIQVIICTVWLVVAPPTPRQLMPRESAIVILLCEEGSAVAFALVLGYIGLLACICLLLAFLARKLPDNFNEARLITFSMLIFCAVWVAFVPAYISSPGKYSTVTEVFAILASSYGLLGCIFAPKCYIILLRPEKNTRKHLMSKPTDKF
uniref:G-protein coupled receptors family 3 profile domain-containing protein n=1 Tax=Sphaeramia orbicularis TaxID=375764 RepID=A0A672YXP0_9TELE